MAGLLPKATEDRVLTGIVLILLANLFFSFIDTGSKWLALFGLPALQLSFMRYFGHFVISFGLISKGGLSLDRFSCEKPGLVILRGALLMASTVLNFFAIRYLPLTLTSTILFSAPIIICALSWPLLREVVGPYRWFAIGLGFLGILIAIRPFDASFHPAVFLSICGAVTFALYSVLTRKLAGVVASDTMQFYSGFVGTFVLLPFAYFSWQNPETAFQWIVLFGLGFVGWASHQLLTVAMLYAPANVLMPFGYSFILYVTIWSYLLFQEVPDQWTILGAVIVVIAGLMIWNRERILHKRKGFAPDF